MKAAFVLPALLCTSVNAAEPACTGNDAAIREVVVQSLVESAGAKASNYHAFVSPTNVGVTDRKVEELAKRPRVGEVPLARIRALPEYKAMIAALATSETIVRPSNTNITVGERSSKELCDNTSRAYSYDVRLIFSRVGYANSCTKAAIYVESSDCLSFGHYLYFMERADKWSPKDVIELYGKGE